ncbi:unnamed protein product [Ilex paraguariensis]|uniref:Kinesin-like protein n=1 Tax=Ilex paraguariensis TaxID=185542 RepID=A0ABC8RXF9_9AQUA
MGSFGGEDLTPWDAQGSSAPEEKIFVSVRLRPLNEREIGRNDMSDWECINKNTIIFKSSLPERAMFPTAYTFDRVFGYDCSTEQVYHEGAKQVALSVVSGINSSIFAYGQTSSGKTYTMRGVTEYSVADIYDYIHRHNDREFVLKFSAMEIYNESVRDLLSSDSTPLRLLDDPERGTVIEKLTEVSLRDWGHLQELLSVCEAQRQIGETSLNELSSRSHQILRLTVESSAHQFLGSENSSTLAATVNFIDLAGSERASQTSSASTRLKEGCHINRSLLTLGTVIRKLSKGRNGHIPFRDSKLTRILQNSLGGNARTAIICTMSPAHSHVEQSRNTLVFASCAKEVNTNAQVNVVMSEKALVKALQRELTRLGSEMRSLGSLSATSDSASLLKEKELLIEKMDKEIRELTEQRDLALSRVEDLLRSTGEHQVLRSLVEPDHLSQLHNKGAWPDEYPASDVSEVVDPLRSDAVSSTSHFSDNGLNSNKGDQQLPDDSDDHFLSDDTSPRLFIDKYFGPDPCKGWEKIDADSEDNCKEVQCIEVQSNLRNINSGEISSPRKGDKNLGTVHTRRTYNALKQKILDLQETIDGLVDSYPLEQSPCSSDTDTSGSRSVKISRSTSCTAILRTMTSPPQHEKAEQNENTPPNGFEKDFPGRPEGHQLKLSEFKPAAKSQKPCGEDTPISVRSVSVDENEQNIKMSDELDIATLHNCAEDLTEQAKPKSEELHDYDTVKEVESETNATGKFVKDDDGLDTVDSSLSSTPNWLLEFERHKREIIELWDACNISLIHRTYFFLLIKGDPSDSVYMEVELRRLSFLKKNGQILTPLSSMRVLNREREKLSRQILKKFSAKQREAIYEKWGIRLDSKQRRQQLAHRLWTDPKDMDHVKESAALVAKLSGFVEPEQAPKEMFGLSLSPRPVNLRSHSWKHSMSFGM